MTLGARLASYRRRKNMTQQGLGEMLCVSAQAVSKWENDQTEPDLVTLKKLSAFYRVPIGELLGEEKPPVSPALPAPDSGARTGVSGEAAATLAYVSFGVFLGLSAFCAAASVLSGECVSLPARPRPAAAKPVKTKKKY